MNFLCIILLISIPDQGVKDGQIRRNFNVSFTVRCEFNTIGYFMMNSPKIKKNIHIAPVDGRAIVPIFTDVINLDDFIIPVGWSILSFPIFKLMPGDKSISFDNVLNESLRTCIDYHLERNIPMDTFITIQFRENGKILQDELYTIDWKQRMIHIPLPNYHRTYRLIIITSPVYVNELIEQIFDLE